MKEAIKLLCVEGDKLLKQGQYQHAIAKYQQAISDNNKYSTAYAHLGEALLKQGQLCQTVSEQVKHYDDAIEQCQRALSIQKGYVYAYRTEGDVHKSKAMTYLNSKDFVTCQEECDKAKECYNSAIQYYMKLKHSDYQIGIIRLSELKALNELLNTSIASNSITSNLDAELDEDEDISFETAEEKDIQDSAQEKIAKLLEALSTSNYTDLTSVLNEEIDVSTLKTLNDWNESVLGNVLSLSDKSAMDILKAYFNQSKKEPLTPDNSEYISIDGGLCHTMIPIEDAREFLGHFYSNAEELC